MPLSQTRQTAVAVFFPAILAVAASCSLSAGEPNTLSPEEIADGWILLFDGETLFGWRPGSEADWQVKEGVISVSEGEPGLLLTTSQFGDFVLKVDFRTPPGTNSGVFLRTSPQPGDVTTRCYELNIADAGTNPFPTGSFVKRKCAEPAPDSIDWQTFEVTAGGGHFLVKLGDRLVLDYTDPKPLGRGYIGLQLNQGKVEFRNVKLKPLGMKSLFNGKDLSGWKTYPDMQSTFSVTPEQWLHVTGGPGQLETTGQYADFTLQLEAFVNGAGINSGVFFRSIPGDRMNGYESQIHNGFLDGDRSKPQDGGTGAIFRRQNARKVIANDREWLAKTIHADDKHMAVWVNGCQVTDWRDDRPPDANPRQGLRLEPGTIIIQGHDPTTDFFFRNLRIAELPER